MRNIAVAIDGPAAAGKSTIAKRVAKILGYVYIDTGAMYRSVTWYALKKGIDCQDEQAVCALMDEVTIEMRPDGTVICCDEDVTHAIRTTEVAKNVSYVASYKDVRLALVELQREMAKSVSVIMDGRDIGTVILPDAEVKIFLTASSEARAMRRYKELIAKGQSVTYEQVYNEMIERDRNDSTRDIAPCVPAADAILLDNSDLDFEGTVDAVLDIVKKHK